MPDLTIVVPTYNEAEGIAAFVERVADVLREARIPAEILIVDDDSPDGTAGIVRSLADRHPVRVLVRTADRGLSSAVLAGIAEARSDVVLVMDSDLSHPPQSIPALFEAVRSGRCDIAVGSRYVRGGRIVDWPLKRKLLSRAGQWLARALTPVRDPLSGFFCCRKDVVAPLRRAPPGYKILLEILARCRPSRVEEVPITFRDRAAGRSKLSARQNVEYLRHLRDLYEDLNPPTWQFAKFCLVGGSGVLVHLGVAIPVVHLVAALLGTGPSGAAVWAGWASGLLAAITTNYALNRKLTFRADDVPVLRSYAFFFAGSLLGAAAQSAVLHTLHERHGMWYVPAILLGILAGTVVNFCQSFFLAFRRPRESQAPLRT